MTVALNVYMYSRASLTRSFRPRIRIPFTWAACACVLAALGAGTIAVAGPEQLSGVKNFGRVTENIFRGGDVTTRGLENLHDLGVRTVIDLAGDDPDERSTCQRLGITHYRFPMDADERPEDATVDRILRILRNARERVYLHCSGGKHRAGTITALYRIRVQHWSLEDAWAEQRAYGFGSPKNHRKLFEYVYGRGAASKSKYRSTD